MRKNQQIADVNCYHIEMWNDDKYFLCFDILFLKDNKIVFNIRIYTYVYI